MPDTTLTAELGRELARARIEAGYPTQTAFARALSMDRSVVSRAETGSRIPPPAVLKAWCKACGQDYAQVATRARAARGAVPEWFEGWRDVEGRSARLGYWDTVIMPAVARTEDYIKGVLGASGIAPSASQVASQLTRAFVLTRAEVVTIVHEMALRRFVASPHVMAQQLRHLAEVSEVLSVHVHVVPNDRTVPGMSGAFSLALDHGVVHMDGLRGRTTSDPDIYQDAAVLWERIRAHALPCAASREHIQLEAERWAATSN